MKSQELRSNCTYIVDTPYEGGVFRWVLKIDSEFPRTPPKGYFLTKIYHPNVSEKGEIWVNTLKKDWNPAKWSLPHILSVIRCLLIIPFPESSLNEDAGKLFMDDYQEYSRIAKMMTKIHAKPKIIKPESDENIDEFSHSSSDNKDWDEDMKDDACNPFKSKSSNLDASMEEEKEPLQNLSSNFVFKINDNSHNMILNKNRAGKLSIFSVTSF